MAKSHYSSYKAYVSIVNMRMSSLWFSQSLRARALSGDELATCMAHLAMSSVLLTPAQMPAETNGKSSLLFVITFGKILSRH